MPDIGYFGDGSDGAYDTGMGGRINYSDPAFVGSPTPTPAPATSGYPSQGGTASPYDAVGEFYRTALGREGGADEINNWLKGTGTNLSAIQQGIYGSSEAQAYNARRQAAKPAATSGVPSSGRSMDDAAIAARVAQWAAMAGADPTLSNDPAYAVRRIKETGGLGSDNDQFWQNAFVGPSAFFNNPNREAGAGGAGGANPGGYTDPSSMLYMSQLMSRLQQAQQPQDNSVMELLKSLALKRVDALGAAPYSAADEQALITKYREPLTQARDAAYQRNKETASAHGYLPSSGLLRHMDTETNKGYEQGIAHGANDMAVGAINQKQANAQQQLQILSSLLGVTNTQFDRGSAQADHAVDIAKMFPDFDAQRLDQLLRASGDSSGSSALNSLMQLGGLNLGTLNSNNATDQANAAAWGKFYAGIMHSLGLD